MSADRESLEVVIWGSCVTRDSIDYFPKGTVTVGKYIARQSLCSAGHPADIVDANSLHFDSPFQRRMFASDVRGDALDLIAQHVRKRPRSVVLIDLVDERGGIYFHDSDAVVTDSIDARAQGLADLLTVGWTHLEFGDLDYVIRLAEAITRVREALQEIGVWERTYVIAARWAETDDEGRSSPESYGMTASVANEMYEEVYRMFEDDGWRVIRPAILDPVAEPENRWGFAPFHYDRAYYESIVAALTQALGR